MIKILEVHNNDDIFALVTLNYYNKFFTVHWDKVFQVASLQGYSPLDVPSIENMNEIADFCIENL